MKRGGEYARRIKRLYQDLLKKYGKPEMAESDDPLEQLVIGILAADSTHAKAHAVHQKLSQMMVDLNELRVTPAIELARIIGDGVPAAEQKAQQIVDALNAVRVRQETLDLKFLKQRGRREAREYLESLDSVPAAAAAHVVLFSLGGHAIPVDNLTLYVLRKQELVDESADLATVQSFLERHVNAVDGPVFALLLGRFVAAHGSRVPVDKLPELLNPEPPAPKVQAAPAPAEPVAETAASRKAETSTKAKAGKKAAPEAAKKKPAEASKKAAPKKVAAKKKATTKTAPKAAPKTAKKTAKKVAKKVTKKKAGKTTPAKGAKKKAGTSTVRKKK